MLAPPAVPPVVEPVLPAVEPEPMSPDVPVPVVEPAVPPAPIEVPLPVVAPMLEPVPVVEPAPAVVSVLPAEAGGMLSRPLVYTAWTRAQRHLSIVTAAGAALSRGVREVGARPRRTRLASLLRGVR